MVYRGLRECEGIGETIRGLKNMKAHTPEQAKALEFGKKLIEDGRNTIYNEEWIEKYVERGDKAIPVIGWAAICDAIGGIIGG